MNSRGQISLFILLIGTLVLVGIALFSFVAVGNRIGNEKEQISSLISESYFAKEYVRNVVAVMVNDALESSGDLKSNFIGEARKRNPGDDRYGNVFAKIERGEFEVMSEEGGLRIEGLFVNYDSKKNGVRSNFGLDVKYSEEAVERVIFINERS